MNLKTLALTLFLCAPMFAQTSPAPSKAAEPAQTPTPCLHTHDNPDACAAPPEKEADPPSVTLPNTSGWGELPQTYYVVMDESGSSLQCDSFDEATNCRINGSLDVIAKDILANMKESNEREADLNRRLGIARDALCADLASLQHLQKLVAAMQKTVAQIQSAAKPTPQPKGGSK